MEPEYATLRRSLFSPSTSSLEHTIFFSWHTPKCNLFSPVPMPWKAPDLYLYSSGVFLTCPHFLLIFSFLLLIKQPERKQYLAWVFEAPQQREFCCTHVFWPYVSLAVINSWRSWTSYKQNLKTGYGKPTVHSILYIVTNLYLIYLIYLSFCLSIVPISFVNTILLLHVPPHLHSLNPSKPPAVSQGHGCFLSLQAAVHCYCNKWQPRQTVMGLCQTFRDITLFHRPLCSPSLHIPPPPLSGKII